MPPESGTVPFCGGLSRPTPEAGEALKLLPRATSLHLETKQAEEILEKQLPLSATSSTSAVSAIRATDAKPDMSGRLEGPATYSPSGERQYTLKFVLTGSSGVGKTQLASRIIRGEFREHSLPTVGMEFGTRSLRYAERSSVRAQVGGDVCTCRRMGYF